MVAKTEAIKINSEKLVDKENELGAQTKTTYSERNIRIEIEGQIDRIDVTRRSRIQFSKRLSRYSRKWKFIFFIINIEAVIYVLLSLTNTIETINIGFFDISFNLISGIFTIYVILLQYYVSVLNYNERALQVHYHQLELQDLKLKLQMLFIKINSKEIDLSEKEMIESYEQTIAQYQLALKNNENHRALDYKQTKYDMDMRKYDEGELKEKPKGKRKKDFTLDNLLIYTNVFITTAMSIVIFYVLFI